MQGPEVQKSKPLSRQRWLSCPARVTVTQAACTVAAKASGGQTVINSGLTASSEPQKGAPGEEREHNLIARNVACKSFRELSGQGEAEYGITNSNT